MEPDSQQLETAVKHIVGLRQAYAKTFAGPEGEQVLADLRRRGWMDTVLMAPNPDTGVVDTHIFAFKDGERNTVLHILEMCKPVSEEAVRISLTRQRGKAAVPDAYRYYHED